MDESNHSIISNGESKITQPLNDANYENVVRAMNKLLADFSQQLSVALLKLPQK
jgi:hypothetical protein